MVKSITLYTLFIFATVLICISCTTNKIIKSDVQSDKAITVTLEKTSFNPSLKKDLKIEVQAPLEYFTTVTIHEFHGLPICTLYSKRASKSLLELKWDGKDSDGDIVPDEAYYIKVVSTFKKDTLEYNPPMFSGGKDFAIEEPMVDIKNSIIKYNLEENSRVMIRAGQKSGILLNSILHYKPRSKGSVIEYWNGKDPDNILTVHDLENWFVVIDGFTLPENSIITYGNKKTTYNDYFVSKFHDNIKTQDLPNTTQETRDKIFNMGRRVNPHSSFPLYRNYPPNLLVQFPNASDTTEGGITKLKGLQRVFIDIDPSDSLYNKNQQFEICFYVDGEFIAEDEIGYVPYNWIWHTESLEPGPHVLSINLASFKDQVAVKSVNVMIEK